MAVPTPGQLTQLIHMRINAWLESISALTAVVPVRRIVRNWPDDPNQFPFVAWLLTRTMTVGPLPGQIGGWSGQLRVICVGTPDDLDAIEEAIWGNLVSNAHLMESTDCLAVEGILSDHANGLVCRRWEVDSNHAIADAPYSDTRLTVDFVLWARELRWLGKWVGVEPVAE